MQNHDTQCTYIEPFAGGASIALQLLINGDVHQIVINDVDKAIYSFWRAIVESPEELIDKIIQTPITIDEWHRQKNVYLNSKNFSIDYAFATLFLNRTNRSGILSAGPIGGYSQTGDYKIDCRFKKDAIINKISQISTYKKNIKVYNKDIRSFIKNYLPQYDKNGFVYFDPPYFCKGNRLYQNFFSPEDHAILANLISNQVNCNWVLTYDSVPEIKEMYNAYISKEFFISYSLANKGKGREILFFKNEDCIPKNLELDVI